MVIVLFVTGNAFSQIPNSSFENWSGSEANSWVSSNVLILLGNSQSMYKSTDAHTGTYACELNTIHVVTKPPLGQFIPDYTGSIFLGKLYGFSPLIGVPYSYRPSTLRFWYKYTPVGVDSAAIWFTVTKWNTSTNRRDTVGICNSYISDSTSIYTQGKFDITYLDARTPDTITILFSSSLPSATQLGSKLIVDDVEVIGGNTGITVEEKPSLDIYPNPANDIVNVCWGHIKNEVQIMLLDIQGKCIYTSSSKNTQMAAIPTSDFPPGIYIIKACCKEEVITRKIIVQ